MKTRQLVAKPPVTIQPTARLDEAARLTANAGSLPVMDGERLVGIVTDRDMVLRGVARRVPADARIDCIMTTDVVVVDADADVREAYRILGSHAVRRLPMLEGTHVVGMITVDDLLVGLTSDLQQLVHPVVGELAFGHHPVPPPAVPEEAGP